MELLISVGLAAGVGSVILAGRFGGRTSADAELETAGWRSTEAEVLSVMRAGDRTFLLVRFTVGSSVIRNDVHYPLAGPAPKAGRRVPVRFNPEAPAQVVFDLRRTPATISG
jgi:hypothetical protein